MRACDYGAPTIRKRWFLIARRDGRRIVWPKPTHGDPTSAAVQRGKLLPWRTAAECIDWSIPCPSIFATEAEIMAQHGLRSRRPLAENTLSRIARGMKRYVIEADRPFLVNISESRAKEPIAIQPYQAEGARAGGSSRPDAGRSASATSEMMDATAGETAPFLSHLYTSNTAPAEGSMEKPLKTVTAGGQHHTLITPSLIRTDMTSAVKRNGIYALQDPLRTQMTSGSFALIAPALATYYGHDEGRGIRGADLSDPLRTVTVENRHALIAPSLTRFNGGATGQDLRDPMATVTANSWIKKPGGAAPLGIIAPVLTYAQQGGGNRSVEDPHHTICASRKDQNCLIAPTLVQTGYGEREGQAPRALDIGQPLGTIVAGGVKHALVAPHMMTMRNSGKPFNGADEPAHTVTAGGAGLTSVAAFLAQHNTGVVGHDPREPLSTIAASGSHQNPVTAFFAKYYGAGTGARADEPCHTITVNDRFGHVQADLQAPPFGPEHEYAAYRVARFLEAWGAWDSRRYVTLSIDGTEYVVVDIGMRMLTPRELFNAQGFPADYVIEGHWIEDAAGEWHWKPFPKDVQVSCCGNSVCPDLARAIISANCGHLRVGEAGQEARHG